MAQLMTTQPESITYEALRPEEVRNLPRRIIRSFGEGHPVEGDWVVVYAPAKAANLDWSQLRDAVQDLKHRKDEDLLDQILAWMFEQKWRTDTNLLSDNLKLRHEYLKETPTLTSEEVQILSGLDARNKSEPASRWRNEGKTFAIQLGRRFLYPSFQFLDGRPHPAIKDVLAALPRSMSGWQKALWFASGNGWLDGDQPQHRLDDADQVIQAACRLSEPASG